MAVANISLLILCHDIYLLTILNRDVLVKVGLSLQIFLKAVMAVFVL